MFSKKIFAKNKPKKSKKISKKNEKFRAKKVNFFMNISVAHISENAF